MHSNYRKNWFVDCHRWCLHLPVRLRKRVLWRVRPQKKPDIESPVSQGLPEESKRCSSNPVRTLFKVFSVEIPIFGPPESLSFQEIPADLKDIVRGNVRSEWGGGGGGGGAYGALVADDCYVSRCFRMFQKWFARKWGENPWKSNSQKMSAFEMLCDLQSWERQSEWTMGWQICSRHPDFLVWWFDEFFGVQVAKPTPVNMILEDKNRAVGCCG